MSTLTLALPKGRLFDESVQLLLEAGIVTRKVEEGRKLILEVDGLKILLAKPKDVPTMVARGYADLGICGYDTLWESGEKLLELLDLGIGYCRICVAGFPESVERYKKLSSIKVATKYPRIAREFFETKGVKPFILKMNGSVELAPLVGMTDYILDLVQTGRTLRENGLVVVEEVAESTARLVCSKERFISENERILELTEKLNAALGAGKG